MARGFLDDDRGRDDDRGMASRGGEVEIACRIGRCTGKAVHVDAGTRKLWVPFSVLSERSRACVDESMEGVTVTLAIQEWFAKKEGLI